MKWLKLNTITEISSPWLKIFCERWQDEQNHKLDYWRVEKADSVIVLPLWRNFIIFPSPFFRVGVNQLTYDLPGGRWHSGSQGQEVVIDILKRELGIAAEFILTVESLNQRGWLVNSSFSNQRLYGFMAEISSDCFIHEERVGRKIVNNQHEILKFLEELDCLQCRGVLLEWLRVLSELKFDQPTEE